jgi:putative ABC transport system permease protein
MKKQISSLPLWAERFLRTICPAELFEEIEGDLIEQFNKDCLYGSERRAKWKLIFNTLKFFRPEIILRNKISLTRQPMQMLVNYFTIASRVMLRNKYFSLINISGLAIGLAGAMLLFLWIAREFSYDQFHSDKERIYQAWNRASIDGQLQAWDKTPRILAPTLKEEYSAIAEAVSFADYNSAYLFTAGESRLMVNTAVYTDPGFFEMFSFPFLKGDVKKVFQNPSSIVITESFAKQLFGDKEPFGEAITIAAYGYSFPFTVTGVLKDLPGNTDFHFDYLLPFEFLEQLEGKERNWKNNSVATYVKLKDGYDINTLNTQIRSINQKHSEDAGSPEVFLYPFTKMHLYSRFENGQPAGGRIEIMKMIGRLGVFLLLIACINFINLSTARAQRRSKEVGVRKVTGAIKGSLVTQFLCESVLLTIVAGVFALGMAYLLLPLFNDLIQQQLLLNVLEIQFWITAFAVVVIVGIVAGAYPAFYLSSFKPVYVLKGSGVLTQKTFLRKLLVVFQFGFATTLIFSVVVVRNQIIHVQNRQAGYDKNNLVYHLITGDLEKNYPAYKNELLQSGFVKSVTKTGSPITESWSSTYSLKWEGKVPQSKIVMERFDVDEDITQTAGIELVQGRDMSLSQYPSDSTAVLINESAAKVMGFQNPVGQIIRDGNIDWHVIGVVKDFVLNSPYQKIKPMVLQGSKGRFSAIHIRLDENRPVNQSIQAISKIFAKYNPAYPFDFHFADVSYRAKYQGLEKTLKITTIFSFLTIFIACLGLLGLSFYMIEAKTKEIGVRKILGGSPLAITQLLFFDTLKPILIAIVLFSPMAWMSMEWWLQSYDYRISLSVWTTLFAGAILLIIAFLTVSVQTYQAAKANPVNTLKVD